MIKAQLGAFSLLVVRKKPKTRPIEKSGECRGELRGLKPKLRGSASNSNTFAIEIFTLYNLKGTLAVTPFSVG